MIRPPECFVLHPSEEKTKQSYGTAVDVWALGVNVVLMLKGYTFVPDGFGSETAYVKFWVNVIGKLPNNLAYNLAWMYKSSMAAGSQPVGKSIKALAGGQQTDMHLCMLKFDPAIRHTAQRLEIDLA